MNTSLILTLVLLTQAPEHPQHKHGRTTQSQRIAAKHAALRRQNIEREIRESEAQKLVQDKAESEYRRMLPFILEAQRQQLQRMSEIERNAAMHRMAAAAESEAAAYQWYIYQRRH